MAKTKYRLVEKQRLDSEGIALDDPCFEIEEYRPAWYFLWLKRAWLPIWVPATMDLFRPLTFHDEMRARARLVELRAAAEIGSITIKTKVISEEE